MGYPLHDGVKIGRWQGFHMFDGDSEPLDKSRLGIELPSILTTTDSDLAGVFVGHSDQPLALERFAIRLRWVSQTKGIDVFECLAEASDQYVADGLEAFNVGWKRDRPRVYHHLQLCIRHKSLAQQMRAVTVLGVYVLLNRPLSCVHCLSIASIRCC